MTDAVAHNEAATNVVDEKVYVDALRFDLSKDLLVAMVKHPEFWTHEPPPGRNAKQNMVDCAINLADEFLSRWPQWRDSQ